jgi:hypothetical protein
VALSDEVRVSLGRHGFSAPDIERVEAFEAETRKRKPRKKTEDNPLDFGDWEA